MAHNGIVFLFVLAFARVHSFSSSVLNFAIWKKSSERRKEKKNYVCRVSELLNWIPSLRRKKRAVRKRWKNMIAIEAKEEKNTSEDTQ